MTESHKPKGCRCDWFLIGISVLTGVLMFFAIAGQIALASPDWLTKINSWQTAISAIIGFTGLIITTALGFYFAIRQRKEGARLARASREHQAKLDRRSRKHQARLDRERDDRLRDQDMRATANTLAVEIEGLAGILESACRAMAPVEEELDPHYRKIVQPIIDSVTHFPVFDASVSSLGHLEPDVVAEIGEFYRNIRRAFVSIAEFGVPNIENEAESSIFVTTPALGKALANRLVTLARNETLPHSAASDS